MDFWSLLVENVFGSFYASVFATAIIFLIILIMGGVSIYTAIWFIGIYLFVMFLGNGVWLVVVPVSILIIFMLVRGITSFIDAYYRGGQ